MYKVLIVEDEEVIRNGLHYIVDWVSAGCIVVGEASNGQEGLEKIEILQPDIVLLDINMPIKNGIELLEAVEEDIPISVIILSGYDDFNYAKKAVSFGVEEYLLKPVDHDELYKALDRAKESVKRKKEYKLMKKNVITPGKVQVLNWDDLKKIEYRSIHVSKMLLFIEENYMNKITMDDLVEELEMSATYLNNKFKESTNYTFNEFLNRFRIQKAIEIIVKGDEKISMIALDVGFSNYRYFIKVFKRYTNALPSDFLNYYLAESPVEEDDRL